MKIYKHKTNSLTYYECKVSKGQHLFAFTLRALIIDLIRIYKYTWFNPLSIN